MLKRTLSLIIAVAVTGVTIAATADEDSPKTDGGAAVAPGVIQANVEGNNFCLGCALKKREGAAAMCSVFGHRHSLRVARATADAGRSDSSGTLTYFGPGRLNTTSGWPDSIVLRTRLLGSSLSAQVHSRSDVQTHRDRK